MAHAIEFAYLKEGEFDYTGWLSTRHQKSDPWVVKFFVLKGVYLAVFQGTYQGNEELRGPQKQLPVEFVPDFEWLRKVCDSDSNIGGGQLKDRGGLDFSVKKNRWSKRDLRLNLQAATDKEKVEWMDVLSKQLEKVKSGELRKPKKEDVTGLAKSGAGYSRRTGDIDPAAVKVQAAEERKYVKFLFDSFLDPEKDATGVSKDSFQELLVSFGLGEGLSDDELQTFVATEFEKADASRSHQLEFDEFVAAYNRLIDLQKEKMKRREPETAGEYMVGKHPSKFQLVPQNAMDGTIINPGWVHESEYALRLRENVMSWSSDDFSCKDMSGKTVIRCEGKVLSFGADIQGFDASTGDLLYHLEEIFFRITKTFLLKDPTGRIVATLRLKVWSFSPDITVYEGAAKFDWRGNTTNRLLYKIDGSFFDWQFKVRNERGEIVAYVDEKVAGNLFAGLNTYVLHIAPGMDASLMSAIAIACDCSVNDA